jgi:feruloyl-CoA synthase
MDAARVIANIRRNAADTEVLDAPTLRDWVQSRLTALAATAAGSSERIARIALEAEAPSFDNGELTDKGAAASRIVLARRANVVAALHAAAPPASIFIA